MVEIHVSRRFSQILSQLWYLHLVIISLQSCTLVISTVYVDLRLQHPHGVWSPPVVETAIQLAVHDDDKVDICLSETKKVSEGHL